MPLATQRAEGRGDSRASSRVRQLERSLSSFSHSAPRAWRRLTPRSQERSAKGARSARAARAIDTTYPQAVERLLPLLRALPLTRSRAASSPAHGLALDRPAPTRGLVKRHVSLVTSPNPRSRFASAPPSPQLDRSQSRKAHVMTRRERRVIRPSVPSAEPFRHLLVMHATTRTPNHVLNRHSDHRRPDDRTRVRPGESLSYQARARSSTAIVTYGAKA
jgi:hypothetical protein